MRAALNVGVTPKELLEVVIQMAARVVPACMNGLTAYREAMAATDQVSYQIFDLENSI